MKKMTEENLKSAFAGESQASMKYTLFADVAEKAGKINIAKLFRATAYAEQIHAMNHLKVLKEIKDSSENLLSAIKGENFEIEEMYPAYIAVAEEQSEEKATQSFKWALEAEKVHSELYLNAKEAVDDDKDIDINEVYICPVCGWTHIGEPIDKCPICGLKFEKFKEF